MPSVLILEDDEASREALAEIVRVEGFDDVRTGDSLAGARELIDQHEFDLVLMDLQLPDGSGMELLTNLLDGSGTDVVVITGHATVDTAVDALRKGAVDYLTKPVDRGRLASVLTKAVSTASLRNEIRELRGELRRLGRFGLLRGSSAAMQHVYDLIGKVGPTPATVLITGPTGTGKELVARMVHRLSRRSTKPFVPINCAAVSATLIESQLFGHEKGSFTGAEKAHRGLFEQADGGTLFLDEITEMPESLQVKLLRVLETSAFTRIGGEQQRSVDVRLVAATNRAPEKAVQEGKLREDLLYRLNVFPIELPALREREGDIVLLARHFLDQLNSGADTAKRLTEGACGLLERHSWPGNVRELRNVIERAYILAPGDVVDEEHLPVAHVRTERSGDDDGAIRPGVTMAEAERRLILSTLKLVDGSRKDAAEMLGISPKTLYNRLKRYQAESE